MAKAVLIPLTNVQATWVHCGTEKVFHPYEEKHRGFNGSVRK